MLLLKCKMCGGELETTGDHTIGTCDSCGSTMTLPRVDSEAQANLFNRANYFRRIHDFDKALGIYEKIIEEDGNNSEAHWCAFLCRYGIEYVVDPATEKRVPTVHRATLENILSDVDYLSAVNTTTEEATKQLYLNEANYISQIQKDMMQISQNESSYDIFICYKETEESGSRTIDSTIAEDIYNQLTKENYNVFFSRITLEDKLGQAYEPYIFSALHSAKVMLVITTQEEYVQSPWVRNEWSRFLALMKKSGEKILIPCYRDMDVYSLPEELSVLQSQDMGKIGFVQDLLRGIGKVIPKEVSSSQPVEPVEKGATTSENLLLRIESFLEEGDFQKAQEYVDRILDANPKCAEGHLYQLCVKYKKRVIEGFETELQNFYEDVSYKKFFDFASPEEKQCFQEIVNKRDILVIRTNEVASLNQFGEEMKNTYAQNVGTFDEMFQQYTEKIQSFSHLQPEVKEVQHIISNLNEESFHRQMNDVFKNRHISLSIERFIQKPLNNGEQLNLNWYRWIVVYAKRASFYNSTKSGLLQEGRELLYKLTTEVDLIYSRNLPHSVIQLYEMLEDYRDAPEKIEAIKAKNSNVEEAEKRYFEIIQECNEKSAEAQRQKAAKLAKINKVLEGIGNFLIGCAALPMLYMALRIISEMEGNPLLILLGVLLNMLFALVPTLTAVIAPMILTFVVVFLIQTLFEETHYDAIVIGIAVIFAACVLSYNTYATYWWGWDYCSWWLNYKWHP